jgi:hypothetical protein
MATDPNDPTTVEHQPVVDRVMEVSKNPDGSPAQREGYEVIDPEEEAAADEPETPQVSGIVASREEQTGTATSRRRRKNTETTAER